MKIGVPKEVHAGEKRVATTPEVAARLQKLGFTVAVEAGAGEGAQISDAEFAAAGCEIVADAARLWATSDVILKVRAPEAQPALGRHEASLLHAGQTLVSFIWPAQHPELLKLLAASQATVLAMDSVPRISRAQKLDALSSMANIAGYRAIVEAAHHFGRFFAGQITAAGKVPPAEVLVIGAGVAGLSAIGTANGLGAIVRAFDTRAEVKDQVRSMGAEFLELHFEEEGAGAGGYAKQMSPEFIQAEMALFAEQAKRVDIIVTTALIPGKPSPKLITAEMVRSMKSGSVIVDMAAEQGGNCELTEPGRVTVKHGVTIIGYTDLPSRLARQSSQLYGTNLFRLLEEMRPKGRVGLTHNMEDEVIRGATVALAGLITWPPPAPRLSAQTAPQTAAPSATAKKPPKHGETRAAALGSALTALALGALVLLGAGQFAPPDFMAQFTVFVLAIFVGYLVVWNVTPSLHTPLMSVTNAVSGIIVIGAILQLGSANLAIRVFSSLAILVATINISGGFLVSHRMLKMFRK